MPKTQEIRLRDPFVFTHRGESRYYLYGTTDGDPWRGPGVGFDVYIGSDLTTWEGPFPAFRPESGFWADTNFWAPELHRYRDRYYLFASFKAAGVCRGTQILSADSPSGPFGVHSPSPVTPHDWECLDGTLFTDAEGLPWIVFCHEWVQVGDGEIHATRLSEDLRTAAGEPVLLFRASQAPWTRPHGRKDGSIDPESRVTDGPFLYRTSEGTLLLLWSSFSEHGYALGIARSQSGTITGTWIHDEQPLADNDSGHGMVFRALDGSLYLTVHAPNKTPQERPVFIPLLEQGDSLTTAKA